MGQFKRGLTAEALLSLSKLAAETGGNWWKELLRLWTPSGEGDGLRLAVRHNTLDFYYGGDVVAHISFGQYKKGEAAPVRVSCHVRYIFGERFPKGSAFLIDKENVWRFGEEKLERSFERIIEHIKRRKEVPTSNGKSRKPSEKKGVHAIVGDNRNVIDLEMALPAWPEQRKKVHARKYALRMDIVALQREGEKIQIKFWEAKTFDDGRLRKDGGSTPEVVEQLRDYKDYISCEEHELDIKKAYVQTCMLIKMFLDMKVNLKGAHCLSSLLHPLVDELAGLWESSDDLIDQSVTVGMFPGLMIFGDGRKQISEDGRWLIHEAKLRESISDILIKQNSSDIVLPGSSDWSR